MKFGINFTSCSENSNFAGLATSGILSLLPVLSHVNSIANSVNDNDTPFVLFDTLPAMISFTCVTVMNNT